MPKATPADRPVRLYIRVTSGQQAGREFALPEGEYIIGRGEDADVVVADGTVSERHAKVVVTAQRVTIEDLGSRNGTKLRDIPLRGVALLTQGDRVFLGRAEIVVEIPRP
jgi:pSer/pThr/pTyr-binding forkhead associated (FHA) protein